MNENPNYRYKYKGFKHDPGRCTCATCKRRKQKAKLRADLEANTQTNEGKR